MSRTEVARNRQKAVVTVSVAVLTSFAVALGIASPSVADNGNSGNAHQCQHGGWMDWVRADGTAFVNTGDCVSYAAHGGTLTAPARITGIVQGTCNAGAGTELMTVTGAGFRADTQMTFTAAVSGGHTAANYLNDPPYVFTDATGAFVAGVGGTPAVLVVPILGNATVTVTATDGVQTASLTVPIPLCAY